MQQREWQGHQDTCHTTSCALRSCLHLSPNAPFAPSDVPPLRCPAAWCSAWKSPGQGWTTPLACSCDGPCQVTSLLGLSRMSRSRFCKHQAIVLYCGGHSITQSPSRLRGDSGNSLLLCDRAPAPPVLRSETVLMDGQLSPQSGLSMEPSLALSHAQNQWLSALLNKR